MSLSSQCHKWWLSTPFGDAYPISMPELISVAWQYLCLFQHSLLYLPNYAGGFEKFTAQYNISPETEPLPTACRVQISAIRIVYNFVWIFNGICLYWAWAKSNTLYLWYFFVTGTVQNLNWKIIYSTHYIYSTVQFQ
jgi:hypothetical protein